MAPSRFNRSRNECSPILEKSDGDDVNAHESKDPQKILATKRTAFCAAFVMFVLAFGGLIYWFGTATKVLVGFDAPLQSIFSGNASTAHLRGSLNATVVPLPVPIPILPWCKEKKDDEASTDPETFVRREVLEELIANDWPVFTNADYARLQVAYNEQYNLQQQHAFQQQHIDQALIALIATDLHAHHNLQETYIATRAAMVAQSDLERQLTAIEEQMKKSEPGLVEDSTTRAILKNRFGHSLFTVNDIAMIRPRLSSGDTVFAIANRIGNDRFSALYKEKIQENLMQRLPVTTTTISTSPCSRRRALGPERPIEEKKPTAPPDPRGGVIEDPNRGTTTGGQVDESLTEQSEAPPESETAVDGSECW